MYSLSHNLLSINQSSQVENVPEQVVKVRIEPSEVVPTQPQHPNLSFVQGELTFLQQEDLANNDCISNQQAHTYHMLIFLKSKLASLVCGFSPYF